MFDAFVFSKVLKLCKDALCNQKKGAAGRSQEPQPAEASDDEEAVDEPMEDQEDEQATVAKLTEW